MVVLYIVFILRNSLNHTAKHKAFHNINMDEKYKKYQVSQNHIYKHI